MNAIKRQRLIIQFPLYYLVVFSQGKTTSFLAFMTGNSCRVILPRKMVELVHTNTAANRIACGDRCLPNNVVKLFSRHRTLYACKYAFQFFRSFTMRPTWSCTYGDVCCFGTELPGLQNQLA